MMDRLSLSIFAISQLATHAFVPATSPQLDVRATGLRMCFSPADEVCVCIQCCTAVVV